MSDNRTDHNAGGRCLNPNGDTICRKGCAGNAACAYAHANKSLPSHVEHNESAHDTA